MQMSEIPVMPMVRKFVGKQLQTSETMKDMLWDWSHVRDSSDEAFLQWQST